MNTKNQKDVLLLVEDNPLLTTMYKTAFEKRGVNVILAHDGEVGYKIAKERRPHVIVLDLLMPGIGGLETLKKLKSDSDTKGIRVIVLTVVNDKKSESEAKKLGASEYLLKAELKLEEIVERVLKYFSEHESA